METQNYSLEHEMSVIGSALLSPEAAKDLVKIVGAKHFFSSPHRLIWAFIVESVEKNRPCEIDLMVADMLRTKVPGGGTVLERCGGEAYMIEIAQFVPSPANALYYAQTIIDLATRREYEQIGKDAAGDVPLEEIQARVKALGEQGGLTSVHEGFQLGTIGSGKVTAGVSTGFESIDKIIVGGGYVKGQQSTIAARQKGGKSSALIASALHAAKLGFNVIYATFADLSARNVEERAMKQLTGFSHRPIEYLRAENWDAHKETLKGLAFKVYEPRKMGLPKDLETFERWLRGRHKQRPVDLILLDYAQKLWLRAIPRHENYRQAEGCSDFIDDMAREYSAAFVVGSQITLSGDGGQEMTKGSRVWEENTALLMKPKILSEKEAEKLEFAYQGLQGISRIDIPLNRFGPAGSTLALWNTDRVRYEECA